MTREIPGSEVIVGDRVRDGWGFWRHVDAFAGRTIAGHRIALDGRWSFAVADAVLYEVDRMEGKPLPLTLSDSELEELDNICALPPSVVLTRNLEQALAEMLRRLPERERAGVAAQACGIARAVEAGIGEGDAA